MTVGDAMDRIRIFDSEESQQLAQERRELAEQLAQLGPIEPELERRLDELRQTLRSVRADPDAFRLRDDSASAATRAAKSAAAVRRLAREVEEKRSQLTALQGRAETLEAAKNDGPGELRLPDPRPAPPKADPRHERPVTNRKGRA